MARVAPEKMKLKPTAQPMSGGANAPSTAPVPTVGQTPYRVLNKGYSEAGASTTKRSLKGFIANSGSAHEDIEFNNDELRRRARILYMSSPLATSAIVTNRTNVIGVGLKLRSTIDRDVLGWTSEEAETWQRNTEREFNLWASKKNACDALGINDFYAIQQLVLSSWLCSGDCFVLIKQGNTTPLMPYSLRLHVIEADRIATPYANATWATSCFTTTGKTDSGNPIYDGVEVDAEGKIVAYHVRSHHPWELGAIKTDWVRIPAYGELTGNPNILHIMSSERPEQYRGVSYLAPVIEQLLQIRRYTESELTAALIESFFTAFIKTKDNASENPLGNVVPGDAPRIRSDPTDLQLGAGLINVLEDGEDVAFADPKRPASGFSAFLESLAQQVGASLGLSSEVLLKKFNSSYSASRAALLEAWKEFRMRREWFVSDFCRPAYELWLSESVARGRIKAPGFFTSPELRAAYLGSEWIGPPPGQLDPVKEVNAEILACQYGMSTFEQSTVRLNGGNWRQNIEQRIRENQKLTEAKAIYGDSGQADGNANAPPGNDDEQNGGNDDGNQ